MTSNATLEVWTFHEFDQAQYLIKHNMYYLLASGRPTDSTFRLDHWNSVGKQDL